MSCWFQIGNASQSDKGGISSSSKLLLVTSHPDDEVMFFTPLLLAMKQKNYSNSQNISIYVLCLSNGDADGHGNVRANELYHACEAFYIPADHVTVVNHPLLRDGQNCHWSPVLIADIVIAHVNTIKPDTVVTFDEFGVSGHSNHIHTHQGCLLAVSQLQLERDTRSGGKSRHVVKGYILQSTPFYRKFLGPLDLFFSMWGSEQDIAITFNLCLMYQAMASHRSQCVWWRILFLLVSRFSFINSFAEMFPGGASDRNRSSSSNIAGGSQGANV